MLLVGNLMPLMSRMQLKSMCERDGGVLLHTLQHGAEAQPQQLARGASGTSMQRTQEGGVASGVAHDTSVVPAIATAVLQRARHLQARHCVQAEGTDAGLVAVVSD